MGIISSGDNFHGVLSMGFFIWGFVHGVCSLGCSVGVMSMGLFIWGFVHGVCSLGCSVGVMSMRNLTCHTA